MSGNLDLHLYGYKIQNIFLPPLGDNALHKISPFGYPKSAHIKSQWWKEISWDLSQVLLVEMRKEISTTSWTHKILRATQAVLKIFKAGIIQLNHQEEKNI